MMMIQKIIEILSGETTGPEAAADRVAVELMIRHFLPKYFLVAMHRGVIRKEGKADEKTHRS